VESSPVSCYFVLLRSKYPPQHPIIEHSQPTFAPQCDRVSSRSYKKRPTYTSVCVNLYISIWKQKPTDSGPNGNRYSPSNTVMNLVLSLLQYRITAPCMLSTDSIYGFHVMLTINSHYFHTQH
jgi:hypothetical protein